MANGGTIVWRVGIEGAADSRADLRSLGDAGAAGAQKTADAWVAAGNITDAQIAKARRANETYQADLSRKQAQASYNEVLGVNRPAPSAQASASVFQDNFAQQGAEMAAARQRQEAQLAQAAQAAQASYAARFTSQQSGASAAVSAAAFAEQLREMEQLEARAKTLKSSIDPLYAAQQKYSGAVKEADALLQAGVITEGEHVAATAAAQKAMDEAAKAAVGLGGGIKLTSAQMMELEHSARAVSDSIMAGRNPVQALTQEMGRLLQVAGEGSGGLSGSLAALRAIALGPVGAFAALGAAVITAGAAEQSYADSQENLARALSGAGRVTGATVGQLDALAEAGAKAGRTSIASANDMETAFLRTGKIGTENFTGLIAVQRDFAAATGLGSKQATEELAKAFASPTEGAAKLTEQLHFLSDAQLEQIRNLEESGQRGEAQTLMLRQLAAATAGAADHLNALGEVLHVVSTAFWDAWTNAGKFFYSLTHVPDVGKLTELDAKIAQVKAELNSSAANGGYGLAPAALASQLDQLQKQRAALAADQAKTQAAQTNEASQRAGDIAREYDPSIALKEKHQAQLTDLQNQQATGFKGTSPEVAANDERLISALKRAIETSIPEYVRQSQEGQIRAELAARPGSADRSRLQAQLVQVQIAGQVLTPQEAATKVAEGALLGANRGQRRDDAQDNKDATAAKEARDAAAKAEEATAKAQETIAAAKAQEATAALSAIAGDASLTEEERRTRLAQAASELQIQNAKDDRLALELKRLEIARGKDLSDLNKNTDIKPADRATATAAINTSYDAQENAVREQEAAGGAQADAAAQAAGNAYQTKVLSAAAGDQSATPEARAAAEKKLLELQQAEAQARLDTVINVTGVSEATRQRAQAEMNAAQVADAENAARTEAKSFETASLTAAKALATTADQRNAIEREQLAIAQKQRDAATQILLTHLQVAAEAAAARGDQATAARLQAQGQALTGAQSTLNGQEQESLRRSQLSPLAKMYDPSSQQSPLDMAEADAAAGMTKVSSALVQLEEGTTSFKKALNDVVTSIEDQILKQVTNIALQPVDKAIEGLINNSGLTKLFGGASTQVANSSLATSTTTLNTSFVALAQAAQTAALALKSGGGTAGIPGVSSFLGQSDGVNGFNPFDPGDIVGPSALPTDILPTILPDLAFADGGRVVGPGSGRSDSITARVSHGEYIVNADAAARHLDFLHAINQGDPMPGFADGGYIGDDPYGQSRRRQSWQAQSAASTAMANQSSAGGNTNVHLHNNTNQPMQAKATRGSNGDVAVVLTPMLEKGVAGMGANGKLERVLKTMPKTLKTRP